MLHSSTPSSLLKVPMGLQLNEQRKSKWCKSMSGSSCTAPLSVQLLTIGCMFWPPSYLQMRPRVRRHMMWLQRATQQFEMSAQPNLHRLAAGQKLMYAQWLHLRWVSNSRARRVDKQRCQSRMC